MIRHLELIFEAERLPPPHQQGFIMAPRKKGSISEGFEIPGNLYRFLSH